jgi:pimeloyl-ACP methyl ester carboxylesterase
MPFVGHDPAVYVEELGANRGAGPTIVMVHGGAHTGVCYQATPDGRSGWAPFFAAQGFRVLLPDWPGSGQSDAVPINRLNGELVCRALGTVLTECAEPVILLTHSMSGAFGWKLLENYGSSIRALVAIAPAPPGNIQPTTPIVSRRDDAIEVETAGFRWAIPLNARVPVSEMLVRDKLVGTSARFPMQVLDSYTASLHSIAPHLVLERQNIGDSQLTITDTAPFQNKPILIITGSDDRDHPQEADRETADWLTKLGARVQYTYLPDIGIVGNGHMLMLEDNSDDIAALMANWVAGLDV